MEERTKDTDILEDSSKAAEMMEKVKNDVIPVGIDRFRFDEGSCAITMFAWSDQTLTQRLLNYNCMLERDLALYRMKHFDQSIL